MPLQLSRRQSLIFLFSGISLGSSCRLEICKCSSDVCQLRLDFETFALNLVDCCWKCHDDDDDGDGDHDDGEKYKETNNNSTMVLIKRWLQPITQFSTSATTGNTNGNIGNAGVFTLGEKKTSRYISHKDIKSVTYQERVVFIYHVLENRYYLSQSHPCFDRAHICNIDTFKRWYLSCWFF